MFELQGVFVGGRGMKCKECPDYRKCVKVGNLTIKRKNCAKAKEEQKLTNGDYIRSMDDEILATQFTQVFHEGVIVLTGYKLPDEILDEFRAHILDKLQQPREVE
jgi:hypothetical protein